MKITPLIFMIVVLLASCASSESIRNLDSAKQQFREYENAELLLSIDPIELYGSPTASSDATATARWTIAQPECTSEIDKAVAQVQQNPHRYWLLPEKVANAINHPFEECAKRHRLKGKIEAVVSGKKISLSEFFSGVMQSSENLSQQQLQVEIERNKSFGLLLLFAAGAANSYTSPSIVNVSPYTKQDGTYVDQHIRTAPNNTCLDNLSGCR